MREMRETPKIRTSKVENIGHMSVSISTSIIPLCRPLASMPMNRSANNFAGALDQNETDHSVTDENEMDPTLKQYCTWVGR